MRLLLGGQTLLGSPQQREQVERPFCQPEYKCLAMGDEKKKDEKKDEKKTGSSFKNSDSMVAIEIHLCRRCILTIKDWSGLQGFGTPPNGTGSQIGSVIYSKQPNLWAFASPFFIHCHLQLGHGDFVLHVGSILQLFKQSGHIVLTGETADWWGPINGVVDTPLHGWHCKWIQMVQELWGLKWDLVVDKLSDGVICNQGYDELRGLWLHQTHQGCLISIGESMPNVPWTEMGLMEVHAVPSWQELWWTSFP